MRPTVNVLTAIAFLRRFDLRMRLSLQAFPLAISGAGFQSIGDLTGCLSSS